MAKNEQIIEKAVKRQVGDAHPNGKWVWTEYKPGKFDWRPIKSGSSAKKEPASTSSSDDKKATSAPSVQTPDQQPTAPAPKKAQYDAPKPKIDYQTKKPHKEAPFLVPESWNVTATGGKLKKQSRSQLRDVLKKKTDDEILGFLNKTGNNENLRQLAYEEAAARGIPEDKIDVSGTLQKKWDQLKRQHDLLNPDVDDDKSEEEYGTYDMSLLENMDIEAFMENFPDGDLGWMERDHPKVMEEFNKFVSLSDRQRYDAFLDYQKRQDPYYESPQDQLHGLNRQLFMFMNNPGGLPIFVSSGGAGAGKTTGMLKVAKESGLERFDPTRHQPGDGSYDFVIVDKDVDDEKEFRKLLAEHNGKIIVFDDKDKLLTSTSSPIVSLMKSIGDGNPEMRVFKNMEGKQEQFRGKLMFITNKSMDRLNKDEDHKAIMSRAAKNDIKFTVNETLEILEKRYKTMGGKLKSASTPQEEQDIRQELYDTILANRDKIDPNKFTVRKFSELLELADTIISTNKQAEENDALGDLFGGKKDWRRSVIKELNKAEDIDIEKSAEEDLAEMDETSKKKMKECFKKNPKVCKELFGDEIIKLLNSDKAAESEEKETEEEVKKALEDSLGSMTIEEAEDIIFS